MSRFQAAKMPATKKSERTFYSDVTNAFRNYGLTGLLLQKNREHEPYELLISFVSTLMSADSSGEILPRHFFRGQRTFDLSCETCDTLIHSTTGEFYWIKLVPGQPFDRLTLCPVDHVCPNCGSKLIKSEVVNILPRILFVQVDRQLNESKVQPPPPPPLTFSLVSH
jgi:hypothetical protein